MRLDHYMVNMGRALISLRWGQLSVDGFSGGQFYGELLLFLLFEPCFSTKS